MSETSQGLPLFSQSIFNPPADTPSLVAACPTIDLSAAVGGGNVVYIRRRGGEIVSKLTERNKVVQALAWKADGQFLAVAWSDGVVRLVGLESPKAVHQIRLSEDTPAAVTFISWSKNLVGGRESWHGKFLDGHDEGHGSEILDLPRVLMFLEVEDDLPKLLPLPVSGGSGEDMFVFSTRTSLEFMFPPLKPSDGDSIHVMVLGTADGVIHVSIYDTFVMGTFRISLPSKSGVGEGDQPPLHLRHHAAHPASSTHTLLLSNEKEDDQAVYLAPMDFTFIYSSPLNLSLLAFKAGTFQKLLRYIKQTQVHMQGEWQAARELPSRFLANIQEDLQKETRRKTIDHALRVAVLTGYVSPTLKQWLVDTIAERGHKRWDKAVVTGLENLRDLIHENLMPALDRATLALSRLRGLAEFHGNDDIGFTASQVAQLMDIISCLILVSHNGLALVTAELELFVAFSAWLRSLIERLALPSQAEEQAEKEPNISVTPILDYITNHLLSSPLELHFGKTSETDWNADWEALEESDARLLDKLEVEMEKVDSLGVGLDVLGVLEGKVRRPRSRRLDGIEPADSDGKLPGLVHERRKQKQVEHDSEDEGWQEPKPSYMKAFPTFEFLTKLFSVRADRVLKDIAESGRRHVHFGPMTRLSVGLPIKKSDVAMMAAPKTDPEESPDALTVTAFTTKEHQTKLYFFRSLITTAQGVSTAVSTQACVFLMGDSGSIVDFQFLDTSLLLVLWAPSMKHRYPRLIAIPVQSTKLSYANYSGNADSLSTIQLDHEASQGGMTAEGLCWVADLTLPSAEVEGDVGSTSNTSSSPIVRLEVLGPRRAGPDRVGGGEGYRGEDTGAARVCLVHADGATYRVFSLPSMAEMFNDCT